MDAGLKTRKDDPLQAELDAAMKRIGELTMENELLYKRCRKGIARSALVSGCWMRYGCPRHEYSE